jgi:two-component system, NtrC family, response regulator PilR
MPRILLVDDEPSILSVLCTVLKAENYDVVPVADGQKAIDLIKSEEFDLVISDIRMTPVNGIEILKTVHQESPKTSAIMLTAYGSVETAIDALKLGAFDYVTKPFKVDELLITVQRALDYRNAISENADLKQKLQTRYEFNNIIAESPPMKNVCDMIRRVAPTDTTILIYGESGTGKELIAKAIHAHSRRSTQDFLPVNCAALPEPLLESEMFGHVKGAFTGASVDKVGLFEAAHGGTIFLDEIGSMPLSIQGKLLRVLQEKELRRVGSNKTVAVDARVLAATNTPLEDMIKEGKFREDLFYRLSVIPIEIPPLRKRVEDILPLVYHVIKKETPEGQEYPTPTADVCAIFEHYSWPGNVRELENAVKHAMTFAKDKVITVDVLPPKITAGGVPAAGAAGKQAGIDTNRCESLKTFLREQEKEYLNKVLKSTGGDKEKAAKSLKISLATLYRKLPEDE